MTRGDGFGPVRDVPFGPLEHFQPEPALPVLALQAGDVVAHVAQLLEGVGHRPHLRPENRAQAEHYAGLLLVTLGFPVRSIPEEMPCSTPT